MDAASIVKTKTKTTKTTKMNNDTGTKDTVVNRVQ